MAKIPKSILKVANANHDQILKLTDSQWRLVRGHLVSARKEIEKEIRKYPEASWRANQLRISAVMTKFASEKLNGSFKKGLKKALKEAYEMAPGHTEKEITEFLKYYGNDTRPIDLSSVAEIAEESIIEQIPSSLKRYGYPLNKKIKRRLALGIIKKSSRNELVADIAQLIDGSMFRARRIVRTEMMGAYNGAHHKSLLHARDEDGIDDLKKSAIVTFDSRTDEDSQIMNGQVRELEEMFVDGNGRRRLHPPLRPNDREKEIPYLPPPN